MKIALITASIGDSDKPIPVPKQDAPCDILCYTELPELPSEWDARKQSKYPKVLAHKLLPDYDCYLWTDASVKIESSHFVSNMMSLLYGHDIVCTTHPDRKNVYAEFEFMLRKIRGGDRYLCKRFTESEVVRQKEFFEVAQFPEEYPLFSAGIFCRWNSEKMNRTFDEWWEKITGYGNYDQAFYSWCLYHHKCNYNTIDFKNRFFRVMPHH